MINLENDWDELLAPEFEKEYYQKLMAEHLPELRKTLGISQSDLADFIGSTRQSINSIENQKRPMMWDTFMSLMLLFISNNEHEYRE